MSELPQPKSTSLAARAEDGLVALAALGIVVLPLAQVVAQRVFGSFVPGASPFTSHLTLIVGLLGASDRRPQRQAPVAGDGDDAAGRHDS